MSEKTITVRQVKSKNGRLAAHQACLKGLGLRKLNQAVTVVATPENMGMINKISYMLKIEG